MANNVLFCYFAEKITVKFVEENGAKETGAMLKKCFHLYCSSSELHTISVVQGALGGNLLDLAMDHDIEIEGAPLSASWYSCQ